MAHVEKYTAGASRRMLAHYERTPVKERSNENIKPELTALNWNAAAGDQPIKPVEYLRRRLKNIRVQNRKDVNVLCDWVVTKPQSLPDEYNRAFFESAYRFMRDRYGVKNVVSAYVHYDEVTPHMHFAFVPVAPDKKRGGEKLCAKEVVNRADLKSFHTELQAALERDLGVQVLIINEATKNGNRTVAELKRATSEENLKKTLEENRQIARQTARMNDGVIKVARKGLGKSRHTEVTIDGDLHQSLVKTAGAASRLEIVAKQWERNFETVTLAAERYQTELVEERRRGDQLAARLKRRSAELATAKARYESLKDDVQAVLDELPPPVRKSAQKKLGARREISRQLEAAKANITQYFHDELNSEPNFENLQRVPLAYYEYAEDDFGVQVLADLKNLRIDRRLDGKLLDRWQFSSLQEMNELCLSHLDWDKLTDVYENRTLEQTYNAQKVGVREYMERHQTRSRGLEMEL